MVLDELMRKPATTELEPRAARVVRTLRLWAGLVMAGRCPLAMAARELGSGEAAERLGLLIVALHGAWPDRIAMAPPCCPRLSHDEATIGRLLSTAAAGDRRAFDREVQEMLDNEARGRLWTVMRGLMADVRL